MNCLFSKLRSQTVVATLLFAAINCEVFGFRTGANAKSLTTFHEDFKQDQAKQLPVLSDGQYQLKRGESHSYRITLTAGQFVNALVEQQGIDAVVTVFSPDGSQLSVTDSLNGRFGSEPILLLATIPGDYRIEIKCAAADADGTYQIHVSAVREATAADKEYVRAQRVFEEADKLRSQPAAAAKRTAIEKYTQSLSGFRSSGDTYRQALTLHVLGLTHLQLNEFRLALPYLEEAISLAKTLGDQRLEASLETLEGGAHDVLGNIGQSRDHYQRAISLAHGLRVIPTEGSALNNIGKLYSDAGDFQTALDYYLQALPLFNDLPNQRAITLNNIGVAYSGLGEFEKALEYLRQALSLLRTVSDKNAESYTLSNIGAAYNGLANYDEALNYFAQARAIQQKTGNRAQEAETLDLTGVAFTRMGQPEKALEFHQQALQIQQATQNVRREAISLTNLGHVYNLLRQPDQALRLFDQSLRILRNIGDLNNAAVALEGRAQAARLSGDLMGARKNIEESLSLIETVRAHSGSQQLRASYLASREKAYEFYVDLLMQIDAKEPGKGYAAEALNASERGRARSLMELLNEARVDIRQGVNPELIQRERDLRQLLNAKSQREIQLTARKGSQNEIDTLDKEISALEEEYQRVQVSIRKASPAYAALTQPAPLDLREIQQQLDPRTLLLEYSLGDDHSYLWVVSQNSLKTYELPKRETIQTKAKQLYDSLTARSVVKWLETPAQHQDRIAEADESFKKSTAELSKLILAPSASEFESKRIVVVADGALQYVPFAALTDPRSSTSEPLIVGHEVIMLPSASVFAVQRQILAERKPASRAVAVIADPVFSTSDPRFKTKESGPPREDKTPLNTRTDESRIIEHLSATGELSIRRLPFTRQEAEQILAVAPGTANLKALDFRANRSLATSDELNKYRYVHFATHGYLDSARADLSAVVLSLVDEQGKPQDGFLRVYDIYNLRLRAELVVLSACETGLGKDVKGEGLVGLTRGFMYAGARRVIVSLWNVNDKATASLMQRLYAGMLKTHKTPAASLRAAQIEMLRQPQWQSPYYWAAFVLQGEWN